MRKKIELNCKKCGKLYKKDLSEHIRNKKLKRPSYCSLNCAANINKIPKSSIKWDHLNPENRIDEFTGFRYYIKLTKNTTRKGKSEISLEDLKKKWEEQKGICPYTGLKLNLQTHSKKHHNFPFYTWASLDRIDSSKSYSSDNVEFVSFAINLMKNKFSKEQVLSFLELLKTQNQVSNLT